MATFILLHGSFHAAWNWHRLLPLLKQGGHRGIALDLPGHGQDRTPAREASLDRCVDAVLKCVALQSGPVVLVAHSRNGIVISQATERIPDRIAGLVYLAAYLVPNGKSMMDYALQDEASLVIQNVTPALNRKRAERLIRIFRSPFYRRLFAALLPDRLQTHRLKREAYREALYHDCPVELLELANVLIEPESNMAGFTPLQLSQDRYGRVPKVYIECLRDRAVTLELQRKMHRETPCDRVLSLDACHMPFFAQPAELMIALNQCLDVFLPMTGPQPLASAAPSASAGDTSSFSMTPAAAPRYAEVRHG